MIDSNSNPPRQALWLLQHLCPGDHDALIGDLLERFREGQTRGWFWKQTLIAFGVSIARAIGRHSPELAYAAGATALQAVAWFRAPSLLWKIAAPAPAVLHWYSLPWPWSQLAMELSPAYVLALAAVPFLAGALLVRGTFRWLSLMSTAIISLLLLTLDHFLPDYLGPWVSRPVPGDPYSRMSIIPPELLVLGLFAIFFVSAWLGCRLGDLHLHQPDPRVGSV